MSTICETHLLRKGRDKSGFDARFSQLCQICFVINEGSCFLLRIFEHSSLPEEVCSVVFVVLTSGGQIRIVFSGPLASLLREERDKFGLVARLAGLRQIRCVSNSVKCLAWEPRVRRDVE